jgi:hypothetical protein
MSRLESLTRSTAAPWLAALLVALSIAGLAGAYDDPRADGLRIDVAAPQEVVDNISEAVQPPDGDTFDFVRVEVEEGTDAVKNREAFGLLVVGDGSLQLQYAGANGPTLNNRLAALFRPAGDVEYSTSDVVPLAENDPAGLGVFFTVLAATLAGVALALIVIARPVPPLGALIGTLVGASAVTGIGIAYFVVEIYDALPGSFPLIALVQALVCLSVAAVCVLLHRLLGGLGVLLGALILGVLGMAATGIVLPVELLAAPVQALSAVLPSGVAASANAGDAYFGGTDVTSGLLVLVVWSALSVAALAVLVRRGTAADRSA